jgi:hypothetical protein
MSKIKLNSQILFSNENISFRVKAIDERFAICTRKFDRKEDNSIVEYQVEVQAYFSKREALKALKDEVIYTIIDFKNSIRSTDNLVFGKYDYSSQSDIDECISDLNSGETELSRRNQVALSIKLVDGVFF